MTRFQTSRRAFLAALPVGALAACTTAEQQAIVDQLLGQTAGGTSASGISSAEAAQGIRAALNQGVMTAIGQVGRANGYLRDAQIKIPLPPKLASAQSTLRSVGLSGLLDELEVQINRGAEEAAPQSRAIFVDAIQSMSIADALGIVRGNRTSATDYFQNRTTASLTQLYTPTVDSALNRTGAMQTFDQILLSLRNVPFAPQMGNNARGDLVTHGVERGLDGLFYYVAQEEEAIRTNPARRTSEILRRVFS